MRVQPHRFYIILLLGSIKHACCRAGKTVIILLDEFDQFASANRQQALYNLLDSLQTTKAQAAIVGISSRGDVLELLEKRVVSRFSHRTFVVPKPCPSTEVCRLEEREQFCGDQKYIQKNCIMLFNTLVLLTDAGT